MRHRRSQLRVFALLLLPAHAALAQTPSGADRVAAYLAEADSLARHDGGKLWGRGLGGPLMLVDPASRAIVANLPDTQGQLVADGAVYRGTLPTEQNLANTAFDWAGRRWTMVLLPLPGDPGLRGALLLHELWHRIQHSLGFPDASPTNEHLASRDGRLWLRLEGRALEQALLSSGRGRRQAASDAILFRRYRRSLIAGADSSERALELNEGLAEYTGYTIAGLPDSAFAAHVATLDSATNLGRSFAYYTGPAYGRLLDWLRTPWRRSLRAGDDLAEQLAGALGLARPRLDSALVTRRAARYGYPDVLRAENDRAVAQAARQRELRRRFVEGPVLTIPLRDMKFAFDPNRVEPLDSVGPVYAALRVVDTWGVLEVKSGGGLIRGWQEAIVPAPTVTENARIAGDGWTLELRDGWRLVAGERQGDYTLKQEN